MITDPDVAANEPVFRIDDKDVRDILGLTPKLAKAEEAVANASDDKPPSAEDKAKLIAAETDLSHRKIIAIRSSIFATA